MNSIGDPSNGVVLESPTLYLSQKRFLVTVLANIPTCKTEESAFLSAIYQSPN